MTSWKLITAAEQRNILHISDKAWRSGVMSGNTVKRAKRKELPYMGREGTETWSQSAAESPLID